MIEVGTDKDGTIPVLVEASGSPMIIPMLLRFDTERWQSHLKKYDVGDTIDAEGRIVTIQNTLRAFEPNIILEHCELDS